jgi:hypothetical protein
MSEPAVRRRQPQVSRMAERVGFAAQPSVENKELQFFRITFGLSLPGLKARTLRVASAEADKKRDAHVKPQEVRPDGCVC